MSRSRLSQANLFVRRWSVFAVLHRIAKSKDGSWWQTSLFRVLNQLMRGLPLQYAVRGTTKSDLAEIARESPLVRKIMAQVGISVVPMRDLLDAADHPVLPSLVGRTLVARSDEPYERSRLLYETVVLSATEAGRHRLAAALRTIQRVPESIASDHADALFRRCIAMASTPIDPYEPPGLASEALPCAVALLQHHPELDQIATTSASQGVNNTLHVTVAAALQRRSSSRSALFGEFIAAWKPSRREAIRFARDADSRFSAGDPVVVTRAKRPTSRITSHLVAFVFQSVVPWTIGPVVILLLISLALAGVEFHPGERIGYGIAVALIALLVAVNVLSTELSANRLPGLIARHTSSSPQLRATYSIVFSLVLVLGLRDISSEPIFWVEEVTAGLVASFLVVIGVWMWRLLERLNPSDAVTAFVRTRSRFYRRAGNRFVQLRTRIVAAKQIMPSEPHVRLTVTPSQTERRSAILADDRGLVVPNVSRIRRLMRHPEWADGSLVLHVGASLGGTVNPGHEIGSVVPSPEGLVSERNERRAVQALPVASSRALDEVTEACSVLIGVLNQVGRAGDQRGATRVGNALVDLLGDHLASGGDRTLKRVRENRRDPDETFPIVPTSLVSTAHALIKALFDEPSLTSRGAMIDTIKRLVDLNPDGSAVLAFSLATWNAYRTAQDDDIIEVVRIIGARAIEDDDHRSILICRDVLESLVDRENQLAMTAGSYLCISAVWRNYFRIHDLWTWFIRLPTTSDEMRAEKILGSLRVGAAGMLSGNLSISMAAVFFLKTSANLAALEPIIQDRGALEQFLSDQGGHYLGEDAEDAIREYLRLAQVLEKAVA